MRRQVIVGLMIGVAVMLGAGFVVWASTQGLLGPSAQARRFLSLADQAVKRGQPAEAEVKLQSLITNAPDGPWTDQALLKLGEVYEQQRQLSQARSAYTNLLEHFPNSTLINDAQARLGRVNVSLLFSSVLTDQDTAYEVKPGDSLGKISEAYHTTVDLLRKANRLDGDIIRPKQKLKIPTGHFHILVDKSQNTLLLTKENQFFKCYTVSTGSNNSTPVGTFKIVNKVPNPVWYHDGLAVPPDDPKNILGTRWMGFDKPAYGIHGTTDPGVLGQQVTAGCVRMKNEGVEELFALIPIGTEVTIVD